MTAQYLFDLRPGDMLVELDGLKCRLVIDVRSLKYEEDRRREITYLSPRHGLERVIYNKNDVVGSGAWLILATSQ